MKIENPEVLKIGESCPFKIKKLSKQNRNKNGKLTGKFERALKYIKFGRYINILIASSKNLQVKKSTTTDMLLEKSELY